MSSRLCVVVLAAGASRRMGDDNKLLLPFRDKPLLCHVLDAVTEFEPAEIVVVLGHEPERVASLLRPGQRQVLNPDFALGLTSSIQAGLLAADPEADGYLICLGDLIFLRSHHLAFLSEQFSKHLSHQPILVPIYEGVSGHPVLFHRRFREEILTLDAPNGCKPILRRHPEAVIRLPMDRAVLRDVDTPEDYRGLVADPG